MATPRPTPDSETLAALPRLPRDEGGPVFAEPWQAQAFALAVNLSEHGHFTWKEWAAALAHELQAAADRGEPDDGSRYYEHWLTALEGLVAAKGLTDPATLRVRKQAWIDAYQNTPHGMAVELPQSPAKPDARWLLVGVAAALTAYWMIQHARAADGRSAIPQLGLFASAGLGSLLGMRHAFEPDHLAAISTLLTGERSSAKAAWLGLYWGIGHTLTLLAAGAILVMLRAEMPAFASEAFEFGVVLLLVGFGLRAIYLGARHRSVSPTHVHARLGASAPVQIGGWTPMRRPLLVGAVHGLAGSGALTALVVATLPSTGAQLTYMALFGAGSTLGMAVLSGLLGWPIARMGSHRAIARSVSLAVGCISIMLGLFWGYPLVGRLF